LKHHFAVTDVGYYAELLGGKEREKALKSVSDQRLAGAQNVQKLLGSIGAALGPKAGADASGHDDTIGVFHRIGSFYFSVLLPGAARWLAWQPPGILFYKCTKYLSEGQIFFGQDEPKSVPKRRFLALMHRK
jgi:hypothetical protein